MCAVDEAVKKKPMSSPSPQRFWVEMALCTACIMITCIPGIIRTMLDSKWQWSLERVPSPVGLSLGIAAVAVGQVAVIVYYVYQVMHRPLLKVRLGALLHGTVRVVPFVCHIDPYIHMYLSEVASERSVP